MTAEYRYGDVPVSDMPQLELPYMTGGVGGGSVIVWASIWSNGRTDLVVVNGNLNWQRYLNDIVVQVVMPNLLRIGNGTIFQDDNAHPHRARGVQEFFRQHGIQRMEWPTRSPDMNPVEHLWDLLDRRIRVRPQIPQTSRTVPSVSC